VCCGLDGCSVSPVDVVGDVVVVQVSGAKGVGVVGVGGLLLITYRTLLAVSSPEKIIMVSVNRFGEQYLDLVCLVFLWMVCLVGLLCLSPWVKEMKRRDRFQAEQTRKDVLISPVFSFDVVDSFHQLSALAVMGETREGFYTADETSLSVDETECSVSVSVIIQQEDSQE
jgi:hypothetical protein